MGFIGVNGDWNVYAIIVTYNPEKSQLELLLEAVLPQVNEIFIIDNGSHTDSVGWIHAFIKGRPISFHSLGENYGIAAAQNIGIDMVKERGAKYVILFDHDSIPADNMVHLLLDILRQKELAGIKVAAIGPRYFDHRQNNPPPFIEIKGCRVVRHSCRGGNVVPVSYLISSGSLIPMETISVIGGMREDLFIDYVDIEWGLRAAAKGYLSFGVCSARMDHDLGDTPVVFMGMHIPLHSPLRHYYLFRNAVWLYRQDYLPLLWKIGDAWRLFLKYGFYGLYGKPRKAHLKMMTKGILHGLIGRVGRFQQ